MTDSDKIRYYDRLLKTVDLIHKTRSDRARVIAVLRNATREKDEDLCRYLIGSLHKDDLVEGKILEYAKEESNTYAIELLAGKGIV